ncbi:MAG TPA: neutral zinc metallopeptidase [Pseudomonadales bacterium]|nr:neutral zinc metallopeptidase [Pseudomonadales bacterium]
MRWSGGRRSSNIEDRRGLSPGHAIGGIGTVVVLLLAWYFGVDPTPLLQQMQTDQAPAQQTTGTAPDLKNDPLADFVAVVLGDTEDTWRQVFAERGQRYVEPTLVLFSDSVASACGMAQSAVGPFYCPNDQKVYIDLSFYRDLKERFQAPGEFAEAYVIAHEVGHHVQNLLGISEQVRRHQQASDANESNRWSVRLELQADCFAGVWANRANAARNILEQGDVEQALKAAAAIGDDRLQREAQGHITPDSFTHGTSAQRVRWFKRGIDSGSIDNCDTYKTQEL